MRVLDLVLPLGIALAMTTSFSCLAYHFLTRHRRARARAADATLAAPADGGPALLGRIRDALRPVDAKIDFSLWDGSQGQMRADLGYIRRLLRDIVAAIEREAG